MRYRYRQLSATLEIYKLNLLNSIEINKILLSYLEMLRKVILAQQQGMKISDNTIEMIDNLPEKIDEQIIILMSNFEELEKLEK